MLQGSVKSGKVSHAYLFTGIKGVGKTSCAISLAQALNCEEEGQDGCGRCPVCHKIEALSFPDLRILGPEGPARIITIDKIRSLRREIHLRPVEGKYKVFVISDADRMREQGANALLKVLEEPPEESVLILTTSHPHFLPPTILSRCQRVNFRSLNTEEIVAILQLKLDISEEKAAFVAGLSEGSPGRAFSLLEWGLEERSEILNWLKGQHLDIEEIFSRAQEASKVREKLSWFIEVVLTWHRDLFMIKTGSLKLVNEDYTEAIRNTAAGISMTKLKGVLKFILQAQQWVELNANSRLVLEVILLRLQQPVGGRT